MTDPTREPRRLDPLSRGAGVILFAIALVVLLGGGDGLVDNGGWLLPVLLVLLGLTNLASIRMDRGRRARR